MFVQGAFSDIFHKTYIILCSAFLIEYKPCIYLAPAYAFQWMVYPENKIEYGFLLCENILYKGENGWDIFFMNGLHPSHAQRLRGIEPQDIFQLLIHNKAIHVCVRPETAHSC